MLICEAGSDTGYACAVGRAIAIRDRGGLLIVRRPPAYNVDWRLIYWQDARSDGSHLLWEVASAPTKYSVEQMVAFTDQLA